MKAAVFALLLAASGWSPAQQAWRCERDGRVVYQQLPCDKGRSVNVADPRSAEQVRAAQAATKNNEKMSAAIQRERRVLERRPKPGATRIGPKTPVLDASAAPNKPRAKATTRRVPKPQRAGLAP